MKPRIFLTVILLLVQQNVIAFNMDSISFLFSPVTQISNEITQQIADRGLDILNGLQSNQMDCFQKSTLYIKDGCQQLISDENSQIQCTLNDALMLTLCELATAQISVPVECQLDHPLNHMPLCIKKLAAAPQTWTTYSGYYRDVVTICFAIRYPLEKDLLLQAQRNMASYQSKNYDMLQQQQQDLYTWRQQEIQLLDIIRLQQRDLWDEFANLQKNSTNELSDMITTIQQVKQMTGDVYIRQKTAMDSNQQAFEKNIRQWKNVFDLVDNGLDSITSKIDAISLWQNQTLTMCLQWQELQYQAAQQWQQSIDQAHQKLVNLVNYTENHIQQLQGDLLDIHSTISTITKPVRLLFHSTSTFWNNDVRLFVLAAILMSCLILPSSPWCTFGKVLVLGFYVKSTKHWPSIAVCLLLMTKLLVTFQRKHYPFSFMTTPPPTLSKGRGEAVLDTNQHCSDRLELYYSLLVDE